MPFAKAAEESMQQVVSLRELHRQFLRIREEDVKHITMNWKAFQSWHIVRPPRNCEFETSVEYGEPCTHNGKQGQVWRKRVREGPFRGTYFEYVWRTGETVGVEPYLLYTPLGGGTAIRIRSRGALEQFKAFISTIAALMKG